MPIRTIQLFIRLKMEPIQHALNELKRTVKIMLFFSSFIDSLVVFMITLLLFLLIQLKWYYAAIIFTAYFIIHTIYIIRASQIRNIDKKIPFLKEQLITANDHLGKDNEVIRELNKEVIHKLKQVKTSYFIKFGKVTGRIITLIIISFLVIFTSALNFQLFDANQIIKDLKAKPRYEVDQSQLYYEQNQTDSIFGNKSIAELGYEEIKLQINPVESDIDISKVSDPQKQEFKTSQLQEIKATTDKTYEESIAKEHIKIVKTYFSQITK